MNSVSIDVDMLESLPAKTMLRLADQQKTARRHAESFAAAIKADPALFLALEEMDIEPKFDLSAYGSIDLSFPGDGETLGKVWGLLRRHGYRTEARPKKGDTGFTAFWERDGMPRIWMQFSSTLCRRVQVGTKMVEQPIYETQCGDLPQLDAETGELVPF
jgi:hypothetical protein